MCTSMRVGVCVCVWGGGITSAARWGGGSLLVSAPQSPLRPHTHRPTDRPTVTRIVHISKTMTALRGGPLDSGGGAMHSLSPQTIFFPFSEKQTIFFCTFEKQTIFFLKNEKQTIFFWNMQCFTFYKVHYYTGTLLHAISRGPWLWVE